MRDNEEIRRPYFDKLSNRTSASSVEPLSTGLGSDTFLTHGNGHVNEGEKVANSTKLPLQAAYTPFGEYRIQPPDPTDDITDDSSQTTFTGHKHNDYIKLIYMGARWYLKNTNRFLSADTIVPDPNNPQSYNRYTYAYNNPIRFNDPTGHCAQDDAEFWEIADQLYSLYGWTIEGVWTLPK